MASIVKKFLSIVMVLSLFAAPAMAELPLECRNLPNSIGPIPSNLRALCVGKGAPNRGNRISAASQAFGWEGIQKIPAELATIQLNTPDELTYVGGVPPTSSFIGACDFAGDNRKRIYCADSGNPTTLFTVNVNSGAVSVIGTGTPFGTEEITSLDWDPATQTMHALSTNISSGSLYTVDLSNGALTRVGPLSSDCPIGGGFNKAGQGYYYDICNNYLYSFDKTSGASTQIGHIGFDANYGQGMDFDPETDTCYMFAFNNDTFQPELRTCNTQTGSTTMIDGAIGSTTPGGLVQIGGAGIAIESAKGIPTLNEWGGIIFAAFLGLTAVWFLLRRSRTAA